MFSIAMVMDPKLLGTYWESNHHNFEDILAMHETL